MTGRTLPWDWYPGTLPANVVVDPTAYIETTFSFHLCRSEAKVGVSYGRGSSSYLGTMFDLGPAATVHIGDFTMLHGVRVICDGEVTIGDHTLLSWNVVLMDSRRACADRRVRRQQLVAAATLSPRRLPRNGDARPIRIGNNVWVGFDACVLPGVTIGDGAVVGAKSVVDQDVPPYTVVAGNPAQVLRQLACEEAR